MFHITFNTFKLAVMVFANLYFAVSMMLLLFMLLLLLFMFIMIFSIFAELYVVYTVHKWYSTYNNSSGDTHKNDWFHFTSLLLFYIIDKEKKTFCWILLFFNMIKLYNRNTFQKQLFMYRWDIFGTHIYILYWVVIQMLNVSYTG